MTFKTPTTPQTILTGDRPTGHLHLGHLAGSLDARVSLQGKHEQTILIADLQALTDNASDPEKVRNSILDVATDYLAVGIDPAETTIALQSALPELAELSLLYLNLITVGRLERNPTIRSEIEMRGFERNIPAGFLTYPVTQAADITAFKATCVPVGVDQMPMIELAAEVARKVNNMAGADILPTPSPLLSETLRLPGIDGNKASKSLGNAIFLSDSTETVRKKVMQMFTDPGHIRVEDPGRVTGNVVFAHLDAFDPNVDEVTHLKEHYKAGGLGDVTLKKRLISVLEERLAPIRERRQRILQDPEIVADVIRGGTMEARKRIKETASEVRAALGVTSLETLGRLKGAA